MGPLVLGTVLEMGKELIDRFVPNPVEKAKAELDLIRITQEQGFQQMMGQLAINMKEAEHASIFVAGWRPWIGWVCGMGFAYAAIFHNIIAWVASIKGWPAPPVIDTEILLYTLGAILGVGTMRTYEKSKGVTK